MVSTNSITFIKLPFSLVRLFVVFLISDYICYLPNCIIIHINIHLHSSLIPFSDTMWVSSAVRRGVTRLNTTSQVVARRRLTCQQTTITSRVVSHRNQTTLASAACNNQVEKYYFLHQIFNKEKFIYK